MFSSISFASPPRPELPTLGRFHTIVVGLLLSAGLAWAQQPAPDLGSWPAGGFTLFVGMWLASRTGLQRDYDTSFPLCLMGNMSYFPTLKRKLWCRHHVGTSITGLVLSCQEYNKSPEHFTREDYGAVWEWDNIAVYRVRDNSLKFLRVGDEGYELTVLSPRLCSHKFTIKFTAAIDFPEVTKALFESLFHSTYGTENRRGADAFLLYWRSLRSFQESGQLFGMHYKPYEVEKISKQVKSYSERPTGVPEDDWEGKKDKLRLYMDNSASLGLENEAAPGSRILDDTICAGQLVSLLIYVKRFPDSRDVNPLIPLLWEWAHPPEGQSKSDNYFFDLRPHQKQQHPTRKGPANAADEHFHISYEINLSAKDAGLVTIEGEGVLGSQRYAWFWSTLSGMMITFFAALNGLANPSLATAMGLSLLRPYSNDNNWKDAGSPVSWNGRRRILWDKEKSCGVFSGVVKPKMGKTGNSWPRGFILVVTSWVTWRYRLNLRNLLDFGPSQHPSEWVMYMAVGLECYALCWVVGPSIVYVRKRMKAMAVVGLICSVHMIGVVVLMLLVIMGGDRRYRQILFIVAESFMLTGCVVVAQTLSGVGREYMYIHHAMMVYWCHMVATSCFPYGLEMSL